MWEIAIVVLLVATALFFTGRSLARSLLHGDDKGRCSGGRRGCSCASACGGGISEQGKEVRRE
jgi:hypothetical protein